jgi:predicted metal-dependent peptidase
MGLADPRFKGMNTKQVFDILKQEGEGGGDGEGEGEGQGEGEGKGEGKGRGNGGQGGFDEHDHESGKELTPKEQQELERDIDQAIRQGVIAASRSRGATGSGNALLAVEDLLRPKVDWREVLRQYIKSTCSGKDRATWRRFNRRMIGQDIYLPSLISERVNSLVLAIDTSGSIGTKELTAVLSEIQGIAEEVKPEAVHVLYWDTAVVSHEEYQEGAVSMIAQSTRPVGGGGTAPSCVPRFLKDKGIKPECVIVFTDGEVGNDWGNDWPAPTLWLIKNTRRGIVAGHGQTIYMEDE